MVQATDIFTLVLRIITVIIILVVFIELIYAFSVIVKTNEMDKVMVELSEGMMSSQYEIDGKTLTTSRAVFDEQVLRKIEQENSYLEPVRHCRFGAHYEFYDLETNTKIAEFGYKSVSANGDLTKDFYVGLAKQNTQGSYIIVPAKITVKLYNSILPKVTCYIETAWIGNEIEEFDISQADIVPRDQIRPIQLISRFEREGEIFRTIESGATLAGTEDERWLPKEIMTINSFDITDDAIDKIKSGKIVLLQFIPIKKDRFDFNQNCIDWRQPGLEGWKPTADDIKSGNRIICIKYEIR